jgi:type II secretory ATPase GspE/PulE/Tfp pilus assembly ATPase PilB-like protein
MSDLSSPPQHLAADAAGRPAGAASTAFVWPAPPDPAYAAPPRGGEPEPCEIEGPNGKVTSGLLAFFDPHAGVAHVKVPQARGIITLRLSQFRRMTLTRPVQPLPAPAADDPAAALLRTSLSHCRVRYRDGSEIAFDSVGHVDEVPGLFTFAPIDDDGVVLRSFFPRASCTELSVGPRLGELLVDHAVTTPAALDEAIAEQQTLRSRKLGDVLLAHDTVTPEQLEAALEQQARMPMVRIGEALKALGFITEAQLQEALKLQSSDRSVPLGELLVKRGDITRGDLQSALARKMGYPVVDVSRFELENDAALRVPETVARRVMALPLLWRGGRLIVAMEDPSARSLIDELEFTSQCKILPVLARPGTLSDAIERTYQRLGQGSPSSSAAEVSTESGSIEFESDSANKLLASLEQQVGQEGQDAGPQIEQSDNSLVRLINSMILEARQQGVSDIHIECQPGHEKVRIRFRRDGVLRPYMELPPGYRSALVARLKIMCDLDISERRKPQDGKIAFGRFVQGQKLELRVATIPTANGLEDVVLRLLASARALPLDGMGIAPDTLARLKAVVERPYGMVLCVGPTGSGKTTTLHAALGHINTPDRKIWTAEDPVEITQAGLRQVQVNPKIDWTFAKALRAFLRADPDVVMVGEIRDSETAQMAIEASLTGHMVMSTLHTNSAPETVTRLLDMGMDPFSFADSLLAVLAQRLVRRLCKHCVQSVPASAETIEALVSEYQQAFPDPERRPPRQDLIARWQRDHGQDGQLMQHAAKGCSHCNDSGFAGRAGLHELLVVSRDIRRLIQTKARAEELQLAAMLEGMRTLRQDGVHKVLAGLTTIEEVRATSNA